MVYADGPVDVPCEAVDQEFVDSLGRLMRRLGAVQPARRVASPSECRFCPIGPLDCPERVDADAEQPAGATADF